MFKNISAVCRIIVVIVVLLLVGCFINFYVLKTINKAKNYSYNVVESNMQEGMSTYLLSDYQLFVSESEVKLKLVELIKNDYLSENSVPSECDDNKSYIIGFMKSNKISYKICLICDGYKSKDCTV